MSDQELFFSLLRITAAQVLRSAGLTTAKPSVLDAFTGPYPSPSSTPPPITHRPTHTPPDILMRYLLLLGTTTRNFCESAGRAHAELEDVRATLEHVGLIRPLNIYDDPNDEDTTGLERLIEWWKGGEAAEMRRVAGYGGGQREGAVVGEEAVRNEEWVAALRKLEAKRSGV